MTRISLLALALASLWPGPAEAQSPAKPDISTQLIGIWEGPYQSEAAPPRSLRLVIAQGEDREWKVTLEVFSDDPPPAGEVRDFKVEGDTVSWAQPVSDFECLSKAILVAGMLKGSAECWQGGAVALTAGFLLEKRKQ